MTRARRHRRRATQSLTGAGERNYLRTVKWSETPIRTRRERMSEPHRARLPGGCVQGRAGTGAAREGAFRGGAPRPFRDCVSPAGPGTGERSVPWVGLGAVVLFSCRLSGQVKRERTCCGSTDGRRSRRRSRPLWLVVAPRTSRSPQGPSLSGMRPGDVR